MKSRRIALALSFLVVTSDGLAQNTDWQVVKALQFGARISVKAARYSLHDPCIFQQANVREVRLERGDGANIALGTGIGAGVGAAIGGALAPSGRKAGAAAGVGLVGSLVGGWFGLEFPILHGPVIYRASPGKQKQTPKYDGVTRASIQRQQFRARRP